MGFMIFRDMKVRAIRNRCLMNRWTQAKKTKNANSLGQTEDQTMQMYGNFEGFPLY